MSATATTDPSQKITSQQVIEENYVSFIESEANAAPEELRITMQQYGYLFFRNLVPPDTILQVRRDVLELCREAGWLDETHDLMEGIVAPGREPLAEGQPEYMAVYRKVLRLPSFNEFPHGEAQLNIARKLLGDEVLVHARRIGRITFPSTTYDPTPPHQDYYYIRGSVETYTCWMPLGECPMELGGLAVWAGSYRRGFMDHSAYNPQAVVGVGVPVEEDAEWHTGDFGLGDALFFHSYTVHKALPNRTSNRLRLSTDNRYQRQTDEIHPASMQPHLPRR